MDGWVDGWMKPVGNDLSQIRLEDSHYSGDGVA